MKVVDNITRMSTLSRLLKKEGKSIGFVPTMGALHEGHLSLARTAKKHTDSVVMSIFVNPIQFDPAEDFDRYPRDFKRDETLVMNAGVDILFCPSVKDMYPKGFATYVNVEGLTSSLCGASRPGHFRGVTTVVAKLFGIVKPSMAYFGQKDAQQASVIKKMACDLNMDVEIKMLATVRAPDGLALSSRNAYLSDEERRDAAVLYRALKKAEDQIAAGDRDAATVIGTMKRMIETAPSAKIDYISIVDTKSLEPLSALSGEILVAAAVFIGKTRLIDNIIKKV